MFPLPLEDLQGVTVSALTVITYQLPIYLQAFVDEGEEGAEMEGAISCCHLHSRVTPQSAFEGWGDG